MNDQSPPKRVTRAQAAAKTNDDGVKTTKIATAAAKAKLTRSASTTKRKTRADNLQEEEEQHIVEQIIEPKPARSLRGRPKKVAVHSEPQIEEEAPPVPAPKTTRGRAKRVAPEAPVMETTRSIRGRAKKVETPVEDAIVVEEPPKRVPRTRAATVTKPPAPKKTVKFEEPDKENIVPVATKGKAKLAETATGLRAKPIRKPAATTTRATRGRAKVLDDREQKSSPLSPKKATQVATAKDNASEDELATTEKTPMKPLMKSPVKAAPGSIFGTAKKLDFSQSTTQKAMTSASQCLRVSAMGSPARRPPQSPFKDALKVSPQKIIVGDSMFRSPFKPSLQASTTATLNASFKASLLQSPARRPQSPTKVSENGSPSRSRTAAPLFAVTPKASTFKMSKFATPRTISKSVVRPSQTVQNEPVEAGSFTNDGAAEASEDAQMISEPSLEFYGRLSSIMPREVDPSFATSETIEEVVQEQTIEAEPVGESMKVDEASADTIVVEESATVHESTPPCSPPAQVAGAFALRDDDENPFFDSESDSEDELASEGYSSHLNGFKIASPNFASSPSTPMPFAAITKTPRTETTRNLSTQERSSKREQIGFTPLARQLSDWMAASPEKSDSDSNAHENSPKAADDGVISTDIAAAQPSPATSTFFDDEMLVRDEVTAVPKPEDPQSDIIEENFTPVELDDEDLALAHEADEMSLLEPDEIEAIETPEANLDPAESFSTPDEMHAPESQQMEIADISQEAADPAPSEASQEYGDENAIPIDPALLALPASSAVPAVSTAPTFATPKRVLSQRVCHTVSKVPLKPAAEETPMKPSPKKRSASISRLPAQRPTSLLKRSSTVISYSPAKKASKTQQETPDDVMEGVCATPLKDEAALWSTFGTPPRTPRRDVDTALLKGAIVFVDVHTTEGADASVLFNELLTQMGARCVKSWNWNGNGDDGSKVGITHVVFKDGGKRTLEKVREAGGVVSCVGVGWVLDCERENKWLDEAPYAVDTTLVPRGGHRRRKSMEPRALANLNGTLVPSSATTPARNSNMSPTKEFLNFEMTPYTSKSRRRESVQWMRSPASSLSPNQDELDDQTLLLSPVPATPAPETISQYGEAGLYGDETPGAQTPYFLHKEQLVQKTVPPAKGKFFDIAEGDGDQNPSTMGQGFLSQKKDESVMMRLMAARRKSLQFAPKVGSPLARGGQW
ncbi:hypothetical protein G7Y89_g11806 [Cudoniella acicularis]|uniref:BRCT domain-containing protein n=1 Tax=Cudoniella acicularis TaxID=354080 RepID=A0A8H4RCG9_9HELO|nr:hypothetical protein G7Y89_g11806 [Cudoniella acicularis]